MLVHEECPAIAALTCNEPALVSQAHGRVCFHVFAIVMIAKHREHSVLCPNRRELCVITVELVGQHVLYVTGEDNGVGIRRVYCFYGAFKHIRLDGTGVQVGELDYPVSVEC